METKSVRSRTISWEDPFTFMRAAPGKTGLELLRELSLGQLPPPPIGVLMGFNASLFEEGRAIFEGEPAEYLYNPIGVVHGGYAMTLLDSAMGCAVHSTLGVGERYTTLELKTKSGKLLAHGTTTCLIIPAKSA
jgi:Thioesterase superfamily